MGDIMKKMNIADLLFWGYVTFIISIECVTMAAMQGIRLEDFFDAGFAGFLSLFSFIGGVLKSQAFRNVILVLMYVGYKMLVKKFQMERLDEFDVKNEEYYRELLKERSPATLSYVDDFQITENDIAAALMNLQLKGKIEIAEDDIIILDADDSRLSSAEQYVIRELQTNDKCIKLSRFEECVIEDAKQERMIIDQPNYMDHSKKISVITLACRILCGIAAALIIGMVLNVNNDEIMQKLISMQNVLLGFVVVLCILMVYLRIKSQMYNLMKTADPYVRTKKGTELNRKIEGLRKFLKDYSLAKDRERKEVELWKEYLVYAIAFGINKKAAEDILKLINVQ